MDLEILYQDEYIIAINKPCGLLVHRTRIAEEESEFALQLLRDQTGLFLYPVHRLDRPTSGVLVFALTKEVATKLGAMFTESNIKKEYHEIGRASCRERVEAIV